MPGILYEIYQEVVWRHDTKHLEGVIKWKTYGARKFEHPKFSGEEASGEGFIERSHAKKNCGQRSYSRGKQ